MQKFHLTNRTAYLILAGIGILLLVLTLTTGGSINLALPLLIIVLGLGAVRLVDVLDPIWAGAPWFYVAGSLLASLGLILFLNVATNDWNAWAYAWLLLVAGLGVGLVLLGRRPGFAPLVAIIGFGMVIGGVTLSALFGMIAGGLFIKIMAPALLVVGALLAWRLRLENILPESLAQRIRSRAVPLVEVGETPVPDQSTLVEPLSTRELEVLRLIDQGLTNAAIAARLVVAQSTVKTHINNIYTKLGVQTRIQALQRARELKLLG